MILVTINFLQDDSYKDDRQDFKMNEVSLNYNAAFQSTLAALNSIKSSL